MLLFDSTIVPRKPDLLQLRAAAKVAVAFEHAIIPLYLYSLYSLDPKRNGDIAALIQSVVRDEMLHMLLACNLLNALGGTPDVESPSFVPRYPCALPGTLPQGMTVSLAPFSLKQVESVFMVIEAPDKPLKFPKNFALHSPATKVNTVGEFYGAIRTQIEESKVNLIVGDPDRQVTDHRMPELQPIIDVASACAAINIIVEQGEGTLTKPTGPEGGYAHYYKFREIAEGKRLVPNLAANRNTRPSRQHGYVGAPIRFDTRGVWKVPRNPKITDYPSGSKSRRACQIFNYTYTALLRTLHSTVNGHPKEINAGLGLMFSLRQQALEMMSGTSTDGIPTGPSFEYQPVMPS